MDTSKTISWTLAWHHCASTTSYWLWIGIVLVVGVVGFLLINRAADKQNVSLDKYKLIFAVVCVMALACAIFLRPSQVAANTSTRMASENHWLGY